MNSPRKKKIISFLRKIFSLLFILVLILTACIFWNKCLHFKKEKENIAKEVNKLEKMVAILKKKKEENENLVLHQMKEKSTLAGEISVSEEKLQRFQEENKLFKKENEILKIENRKLTDDVHSCNQHREELSQKLENREQELVMSNQQSAEVARKLTSEKEDIQKTLGKELERLQQALDKSSADNDKLSRLAHEILEKYADKGFIDIIMQKEPFTQLKKVMIEEMMQEYKEKIDE